MSKKISVLAALVLILLSLIAFPVLAEHAEEEAYDPDADPMLNAVVERAHFFNKKR